MAGDQIVFCDECDACFSRLIHALDDGVREAASDALLEYDEHRRTRHGHRRNL